MHPLSMKDRDPCVRLSEQSYSTRHLNRARHMDPQASSTRDRPLRWIKGAERRSFGELLERQRVVLLKCDTPFNDFVDVDYLSKYLPRAK